VTSSDPYIYIWEFRVQPATVGDFIDLYGPGGDWTNLFQRAAGWLGTDLLRDRHDPLRFITIDRWESKVAFDESHDEFAAEFDRLDRLGESLTVAEKTLGRFQLIPGTES
jgi:quinol monooxygenase YgiN